MEQDMLAILSQILIANHLAISKEVEERVVEADEEEELMANNYSSKNKLVGMKVKNKLTITKKAQRIRQNN
jgi:hypothetical protein